MSDESHPADASRNRPQFARRAVRSPFACQPRAGEPGLVAGTTSPRFSSASAVLRLVVVKRDRMAGEFIRHAASTTGLIGEAVCCQTAGAALQALRSRATQFGIFGLTLSDMDGLDLISSVVAERLLARVLVVSARCDERVRSQLRRGQIDGFVDSENDDCSRLPEIVRQVADGGSYFSPTLVSARPKCEGPSLIQMLTPHEMKVFAVVGNGCDDREAAVILGLSQHTVHGHRRRIMQKVGVQTRSGLMRVAIQRGLVRITPQGVLRPGFEWEIVR